MRNAEEWPIPEWAKSVMPQHGRWVPKFANPVPPHYVYLVARRSGKVGLVYERRLTDQQHQWLLDWISAYDASDDSRMVDYVAFGLASPNFMAEAADGIVDPAGISQVVFGSPDGTIPPGSAPAPIRTLLQGARESLHERLSEWRPDLGSHAPPLWIVFSASRDSLDVLSNFSLASDSAQLVSGWLAKSSMADDPATAGYVTLGLAPINSPLAAGGRASGLLEVTMATTGAAETGPPGTITSAISAITARAQLYLGNAGSLQPRSDPGVVERGFILGEGVSHVGHVMTVQVHNQLHETIHSWADPTDFPFERFCEKAEAWGMRYTDFIGKYDDAMLNSVQLNSWIEEIPLILEADILDDSERRAAEQVLEAARVAREISGFLFIEG